MVIKSPGLGSPTLGVQGQPLTVATRLHSPHCTEEEALRLMVKSKLNI